MAVVIDRFGTDGVEVDPNVPQFLDSHPALKARLSEILQHVRRYFNTETLHLIAERDPDDHEWEYLLIEIMVQGALEPANRRRDQLFNDYLLHHMHEYPAELIVVVSAK